MLTWKKSFDYTNTIGSLVNIYLDKNSKLLYHLHGIKWFIQRNFKLWTFFLNKTEKHVMTCIYQIKNILGLYMYNNFNNEWI